MTEEMDDIQKSLVYLFDEPQKRVDSREQLLRLIQAKVNELINHDFNGLLALLYRLDVDEKKINNALNKQTDRDAGEIIAEIILEREERKAEWRKKMKENNPFSNKFDDELDGW